MKSEPPHHSRRFILVGAVALTVAGCDRARDPSSATEPVPPPPPQSVPTAASGTLVVTMLGDSITAGYGLSASDALPAQLETVLKASGLAVRVRAAGVSGDTSAGGLARVDFSVQDDTALCIVALGGNDMLQGLDPAVMRSNLDQIIEKLKSRKIPVLLAGMQAPPQYGTYAVQFDKVFSDLAKENDVAFYPFLLKGVALDRRYNQADGIHPNARGAKIIAADLAPVVADALRKRGA